jgi:predicted GTPase
VIFTIGGSRCGKSTVCNALLYGDAAEKRFSGGKAIWMG